MLIQGFFASARRILSCAGKKRQQVRRVTLPGKKNATSIQSPAFPATRHRQTMVGLAIDLVSGYCNMQGSLMSLTRYRGRAWA